MANKPKYINFVTPRLVLQWPKLNKPDTKWKAEGQYTARGACDPAVLPAGIIPKLEKLREDWLAFIRSELEEKLQAAKAAKKGADAKKIQASIDALHLTDHIFAPELDKESGEETGKVIINAKMLATRRNRKTGAIEPQSPQFADAKGTVLKKIPEIWGGTEAKLAVAASGYHAPNDGAVGITFYLNAVQILKLVSRGGQGNHGFSEEEGYEAEEAAETPFTADSAAGEPGENEDF